MVVWLLMMVGALVYTGWRRIRGVVFSALAVVGGVLWLSAVANRSVHQAA